MILSGYTRKIQLNIFYLDKNPIKCARVHCDKHVVKMIIEYAQIMSTAHRVLDGQKYTDKTKNGRNITRWRHPNKDYDEFLYKATHVNHPSTVWASQSKANYIWLYSMWRELCREYSYRYGKRHLTDQKLRSVLFKPPQNIPVTDFTDPPQAMPIDVHCQDTITAYRNYYRTYKNTIAKWTRRQAPRFMQ